MRMIQLDRMTHAHAGRAVGTRRGGEIDLAAPDPARIRILDLAERMSRIAADASAGGFYSLAQRAALLANGVAPASGALAGVYAAIHLAPLALTGALEYGAMFAADHLVAAGLEEMWHRLHEAICDALDLDHPPPAALQADIAVADARLRVAELRIIAPGTKAESDHFLAHAHRPLVGRIVPVAPDRASEIFLATFARHAGECGLRRTRAWEGVP